MKQSIQATLAATSVLAITLLAGCSSSSKTAPAPAPTPAPVEAPAPTIVEPQDFVEPTMTEEVLPSDIAEMNRMAQARGWIRDVFFEYDQWALSAESQDALALSGKWLREHPAYSLLIEGHCDERGTGQYNLSLGDRRASIVKDYLVQLGVDGSRVRTISYGEERPFDEGHDESAWSQNRRGHLVLIGK